MTDTPPPQGPRYGQWSPDARALDLVGDKWTLLIVRDLAAGPRRFTELLRMLPGISSQLLSRRLGRMVADGLLTRGLHPGAPPCVAYELTARSRQLLFVVGELARWGYRWAWSAPRALERVDIGAILRIAPGLVRLPADVDAVIELTAGSPATSTSFTLTISRGAAAIAERRATEPDAHVSGSQQDWIAALAHCPDRAGLCIEGDERLALMVLDLLAPASGGRGGAQLSAS